MYDGQDNPESPQHAPLLAGSAGYRFCWYGRQRDSMPSLHDGSTTVANYRSRKSSFHLGLFKAALESEVLECNCILPDAIERVDVMHLQLKKRALRHDHLGIRLGHILVLVQVKLIGAAGTRQECCAVALCFFFGGKI